MRKRCRSRRPAACDGQWNAIRDWFSGAALFHLTPRCLCWYQHKWEMKRIRGLGAYRLGLEFYVSRIVCRFDGKIKRHVPPDKE